MPSYATYRVNDQKCITCSFWNGNRTIQLVANKPTYVKAEAGSAQCMVNKNRRVRHVDRGLGWKLWEKIR